MSIQIFQVDAFTEKPFSGNPAGVCLLEAPKPDAWMQNVAAEMNLSETAFLLRRSDGWNLGWFTPRVEVDLCGHATLASAHVLHENGILSEVGEAKFHTKSGLLKAKIRNGLIELDFPAKPEKPSPPVPGLVESLGVAPVYVGRSQFDYLIAAESEDIVRNLAPDFERLKRIEVRGVIVTARSAVPDFDFVSRFFAPAVGINEDPVTGSAHCCLGPYWMGKLGKSKFKARQLSSRGGELEVEVSGDRVLLRGKAITVIEGKLIA